MGLFGYVRPDVHLANVALLSLGLLGTVGRIGLFCASLTQGRFLGGNKQMVLPFVIVTSERREK